jgi:alanyl-tRNA synthetase
MMTTNEIRDKFINYFKNKNHVEIKNSSLIPENDPSVLFTTAGMHPLVPYLLGEKHPAGKRLVNVQKCIRTIDIDEVGDDTHLTFFEMLGNWSLGDYFKKEAIAFSVEFLTKELEIPLEKLAVTCFSGDDDAPKDEETANIWMSLGVSKNRIAFLSKDDNWWPAGGKMPGPQGPDTEMFYWTSNEEVPEVFDPSDKRWVEIWNNVFMQYNKLNDGTFEPLQQKNVDTGMGLERIYLTINNCKTVYDIEIFKDIISKIESLSGKEYNEVNKRAFRIIADHVRTATFILGDEKGVTPSNTDQGYILRRLIRRACRYLKQLDVKDNVIGDVALVIIDNNKNNYPELINKKDFILNELYKEEVAFNRTLSKGINEFNKIIAREKDMKVLPGDIAFRLYDTFGFPFEMTKELCKEKNIEVDTDEFEKKFHHHQELSRVGAEQKFKGGLADNSVETTKLHTATHLLNAALKIVLNDNNINQRGSNINAERLRFDFSFDRKVTQEELVKVEELVNKIINQKLDVVMEEKTLEEAKKENVVGVFEDRYGERVKVYSIGNFSREICGGPHVKNTSELGYFKIVKEESSSAGVRRIKAILCDKK